jgi:hypothetical protein
MAGVPMLQFLNQYGLIQLGASHELIVPGRIVTKKVARPVAYLKNLLEGTSDEWPTRLIRATLPDQLVWDSDLTGKASLKIPGIITIGGGLRRAAKGRFSVSQVHARVFSLLELDEVNLRVRVEQWRRNPRAKPLYKRVKGKTVVQSTWYASELTLHLEAPREIDMSAKVPVKKITVAGEGEFKWTSKTTLKIKGNDKVPFAIQGWII